MSVRIGSCSSPADATLVRSMFRAHGIDVTISGEQHASLLGPLNGGFISLDIWVQPDDAEQATELLAEMREHLAEDDRDARDAEQAQDDLDEPDRAGESIDIRITRRKRTGIALLLAFCISFGTAHLSAGAWLRGLVLAGVEVFGISRLGSQPKLGAIVVATAITLDAIGSVLVLRKKFSRAEIPRARVI